jgi:hypothetical protein
MSNGKIVTDVLNRDTFVLRVMESKSGLLLKFSLTSKNNYIFSGLAFVCIKNVKQTNVKEP